MDIVDNDNCRYEIQEQKELPVWYTGIYLTISSNECVYFFVGYLVLF
jgi:hypothetical protein